MAIPVPVSCAVVETEEVDELSRWLQCAGAALQSGNMSLYALGRLHDYMAKLQSNSFWQRAGHNSPGVPREEVTSIRIEIFSVTAIQVKPGQDQSPFLKRTVRVLSALFRLIKRLCDSDRPLEAERMLRMAADIGMTCN